jgi:hypothetical protein
MSLHQLGFGDAKHTNKLASRLKEDVDNKHAYNNDNSSSQKRVAARGSRRHLLIAPAAAALFAVAATTGGGLGGLGGVGVSAAPVNTRLDTPIVVRNSNMLKTVGLFLLKVS